LDKKKDISHPGIGERKERYFPSGDWRKKRTIFPIRGLDKKKDISHPGIGERKEKKRDFPSGEWIRTKE